MPTLVHRLADAPSADPTDNVAKTASSAPLEPTEEIRLAMLQCLLHAVMQPMQAERAMMAMVMEDCVRILIRTLQDPFQNVRKVYVCVHGLFAAHV